MNTNTLNQLFQTNISNLREVLRKDMKEFMNEFAEKMNNLTPRIATLEGRASNSDLSIEPEVTDAAKHFLQNKIANKYQLPYTYKPGKDYVKTLKDPKNKNQWITDLDGCYILSNSQANARVRNDKPIPDGIIMIQSRIRSLESNIGSTTIQKNIRNEKLKQLKTQLRKLEVNEKNRQLDKTRQNETQQLSLTIPKQQDKRFMAVIEAKYYLSKTYVEAQADKMMNLIEFFASACLYYKAHENNMLNDVISISNWTKNFTQLCRLNNMRFDGIVVILGGPYSNKKIQSWFDDMKEEFNTSFSEKVKELQERLEKTKIDFNRFVLSTKLEFYQNIKVEFGLLITNGIRFSDISANDYEVID